MPTIDTEKISVLQTECSVGVIYALPACVPDELKQMDLCRVSFTQKSNTGSIDHFLTRVFKPDFILLFECAEKRILKRLYGFGCPVIKFVNDEREYCCCGHDHTLFSWWTMVPKKWCDLWCYQRVQFWKQSICLVLRLKKYRKGLMAKGVSNEVIQFQTSASLSELIRPIITDFGL